MINRMLSKLGYRLVPGNKYRAGRRSQSKRTLTRILSAFNVDITRVTANSASLPADMDDLFRTLYPMVQHMTCVPFEPAYATYQATKYIAKANISGAVVECGVWLGGMSRLILDSLHSYGDVERDVYFFDTFSGMVSPGVADEDFSGRSASLDYDRFRKMGIGWYSAGLAEVQANLAASPYPAERMHFVQGGVEETIPENAPQDIALLRLDTDWYESTHHEMIHLFPRLVKGGVLIVDDYGSFKGARKAVDDYLTKIKVEMLLVRTGGPVIGIKQS